MKAVDRKRNEKQPSATRKAVAVEHSFSDQEQFDAKQADRLKALEAQITEALSPVGEAFAEIEQDSLYLASGHPTFADYLRERWDISRATAYRWIDWHRVTKQIAKDNSKLPPPPEGVCGVLKRVAHPDQAKVWATLIANDATTKAAAEQYVAALDKARPTTRQKPKNPAPAHYRIYCVVPQAHAPEILQLLGVDADPIIRYDRAEIRRKKNIVPAELAEYLRSIADWFHDHQDVPFKMSAA